MRALGDPGATRRDAITRARGHHGAARRPGRAALLVLVALGILFFSPAPAQTEEVVTDAPADAPVDVSDLPALPILEIPLYVGTTRADFAVYEGENLNDAAEKFGVAHALSPESLASLKDEVARRLLSITEAINANRAQSADAKQLLFEVPMELESGEVVNLRLYEGDVLEQAVAAFVARHGFDEDAVPLLMEGAMASIEKARAAPEPLRDEQGRLAIVSLAVSFDAEEEEADAEGAAEGEGADADGAPKTKKQLPPIVLFEGQTPEEAATAYCEANGLDPEVVGPQLADVLRQGAAKREAAIAEAAAAEAAEQEASREPEGEEEASETAEEASETAEEASA